MQVLDGGVRQVAAPVQPAVVEADAQALEEVADGLEDAEDDATGDIVHERDNCKGQDAKVIIEPKDGIKSDPEDGGVTFSVQLGVVVGVGLGGADASFVGRRGELG